jgi:hypothetical protein
MALSIPPVQSGNVIAASLMNQIIQALSSLDTRVTALEGAGVTTAGAPDIQSYSPTTNLHVGDQLTVAGQNLWAAGMNAVFITLSGTSTRVTQFATQNDTQLVFNIPAVSVQPTGSLVSLQVVSPTQGSDSVSFTLLPAAVTVPTGGLRIQLAAASGTTFNAPGTYQLSYTINATTTLGDTYDLIPAVVATPNIAGWAVTMLNSSNAPVSNATLYIAAAPSLTQPTIVTGNLQLTIPSGATGSAALTLEVKSHLNPTGLDKTSPTVTVPVGGTVLLSSGIGIAPEPNAGELDASGNLLVPITGLQLSVDVTITTPGSYSNVITFDNSSWSAIVQSPFPYPAGTTAIQVMITPSAGAQPSNLYITITSLANSSVATQVFYPVVLAS